MKDTTTRLVTLVESLSRQSLSGCLWIGGVLAGIALIAVLVIEVRAPQVLLPVFLAMALGWMIWLSAFPPEERVSRLMRQYRYEQAFRVARHQERMHAMLLYFREILRLPAESLRPRLERAFTELRVLHASVYDPTNTFISPSLKSAMQESSDSARAALWNLCRNLDVVARQEVVFPNDHPKVMRLTQVIDQLTQSAADARLKLAELSLGANESEVHEAKLAIENVRRQSEALLELEAALS